MELSEFEGKPINVILQDGRQFEAVGVDYMIGTDYDEKFNSLSLRITKVLKDGPDERHNLSRYINGKMLYAIYENQKVKISLLKQ